MAKDNNQRKVSHHRRIKGWSNYISKSKILPGSIYEFSYSSRDRYDPKPLVFILDVRGKNIKGININYLNYYRVDQLLQERKKWTDTPTLRMSRKFQWYELYDQAIRTYSKNHIRSVREVMYKYRTEDEL
tara:strand:+ start:318 stop:707 length:390 start_codon:yes stop_codon:yes gene_type:complete